MHQRRALHMQGALSRILVTCGHRGTQTHLKVEAKQNNLNQIWYDKVSFLVRNNHILGDIFDYFWVHHKNMEFADRGGQIQEFYQPKI